MRLRSVLILLLLAAGLLLRPARAPAAPEMPFITVELGLEGAEAPEHSNAIRLITDPLQVHALRALLSEKINHNSACPPDLVFRVWTSPTHHEPVGITLECQSDDVQRALEALRPEYALPSQRLQYRLRISARADPEATLTALRAQGRFVLLQEGEPERQLRPTMVATYPTHGSPGGPEGDAAAAFQGAFEALRGPLDMVGLESIFGSASGWDGARSPMTEATFVFRTLDEPAARAALQARGMTVVETTRPPASFAVEILLDPGAPPPDLAAMKAQLPGLLSVEAFPPLPDGPDAEALEEHLKGLRALIDARTKAPQPRDRPPAGP